MKNKFKYISIAFLILLYLIINISSESFKFINSESITYSDYYTSMITDETYTMCIFTNEVYTPEPTFVLNFSANSLLTGESSLSIFTDENRDLILESNATPIETITHSAMNGVLVHTVEVDSNIIWLKLLYKKISTEVILNSITKKN